MTGARIERLGDQALLVRLADRIEPAINLRVHQCVDNIRRRSPPWLLDCVPAYASFALFVDGRCFPDAIDPLAAASSWLAPLLEELDCDTTGSPCTLREIPVCYDSDHAPDLDEVAAALGMDREEVISRHLSARYRVAMLGFAAGFPYLIGMDPALAMPRLATPRTRVPAGSVAIGGAQTGIYPRESPGGWRIIGRTPQWLFDAGRDPPVLLAPGDEVKFSRISVDELRRLEARR